MQHLKGIAVPDDSGRGRPGASSPVVTGPAFATFTDAYLAVLAQVADSPRYEIATRGNTAREILNVCFTVRDPVARSPYLAARKANIVFNHAEVLWYLSGRDDLAMIGHYGPRLRRFSADGQRLTGTAYGPRLFRPGPDGASHFDRVIALLRTDPDTKRAAMVVMQPGELADPANPDVACTLALHLMLRGGALHMTAHMRANDAVTGLLCDVFSFTFIQEYAARLLGTKVGAYTHHAGSMHINLPDLAKARAIVREATDTAPPRFPATAMPADHLDDLAAVLAWEQALRLNQRTATPSDPGIDGLHPYWRQIVMLFEAHRQITRHPDDPVDAATLAALHPGHRWLLARRWPRNIPALPEAAMTITPRAAPTSSDEMATGVDWSLWTVILLKPDCLARNLVRPVLAMAAQHVGITTERVVYPTVEQVFTHYADILPLSAELGVDVAAELRRIYLGHPVAVALGHGSGAAARLRAALGPTDPAEAGPDTIRGRSAPTLSAKPAPKGG
jgi:thymidylate synthase